MQQSIARASLRVATLARCFFMGAPPASSIAFSSAAARACSPAAPRSSGASAACASDTSRDRRFSAAASSAPTWRMEQGLVV